MSTNRELFVIFGYKGSYEDFYPKEYADFDTKESLEQYKNIVDVEQSSEEIGDCTIVSDGMSGDYSYFGILVERFGKDGWDEQDADLSISEQELEKFNEKLSDKVRELNLDITGLDEPSLHIFHHYT